MYHSLSMFQHKDILFVCLSTGFIAQKRQITDKYTNRQTDKQKYLLTDTAGRGEEIPFVYQCSRTEKFCLSTRFIAQKSHITDKYTNGQTDKHKILTRVLSVHWHSWPWWGDTIYLSRLPHKDILFVDRIYSPKEPQNRQIYKWTNRQTKNTYSGSFCPLTQLAVVRRYHLFIKAPAQRNFVCRPDL